MATQIIMPKLGATMEEGTIVKWLVEVGDEIEEGDPIAEILTDKITLEIESTVDGVVLKTFFEEGDVVEVQSLVAYIGEEGEVVPENAGSSEAKVDDSPDNLTANDEAIHESNNGGISTKNKVRRTPAARKLAEDNKVKLESVEGTGPKGRVKKQDVKAYINKKGEDSKVTPLAQKTASINDINTKDIKGSGVNDKVVQADVLNTMHLNHTSEKVEERKPFTGMRKMIADRLSISAYTAPHVTLTSEIDMTEVVEMRKKLIPTIESQVGLRVSYNEILIKAVASTLKSHNNINLSLQGNEIIYHADINIGFAVAIPDGLVVPVIKDASNKGLGQIIAESKELGNLAKMGNLTSEQMTGGTFTISNLGMFAVDAFNPIINQPESAILGVGRIVEKPIGINGEIKLRSMMTLSLSFDHRVIDGAPAASFLTDLKDMLENPMKLII